MQIQLLPSVLLVAMCAKAVPVTITGGGTDDTPTVVESNGTDVVNGGASDTDDPGKTIFVPDTNAGATVIPTQEDPSVLSPPGGVPVTITPGSDGVVIVPGNNGGTGGAVIS